MSTVMEGIRLPAVRVAAVAVVVFGAALEASPVARQGTPPPLAYSVSTCTYQSEFCPDVYWVATPYGVSAGPADSHPTWSPDGSAVAYASFYDIIVANPSFTVTANLTNSSSVELAPSWSPDGRRIAFISNRDGGFPELYVMNADGSDAVRLTYNIVRDWFRPTWSPDSQHLAFTCLLEPNNLDICQIRPDGTGLQRLTTEPSADIGPAWSPDGASIAFTTTQFNGDYLLALLGVGNGAVTMIGAGIPGFNPAWSPDGRQIAYSAAAEDVFGVWTDVVFSTTPDGIDAGLYIWTATTPSWMPGGLFATFHATCNLLTCDVNAAGSVGDIASYSWSFGDGTTATGSIARHTYQNAGTYTITLTVVDSAGHTSTFERRVSPNRPPVAALAVSCDEQRTCLFNWSGSFDPEGYPVWISLAFGDGQSYMPGSGGPTQVSHTYASDATYTAILTVWDQFGFVTASQTFSVVKATPIVHIGDIDLVLNASRSTRTVWVTMSVHTDTHAPQADVVVHAQWSDGSVTTCTTAGGSGACTVARSFSTSNALTSVTVLNVTQAIYVPSSNHDPDGDSNGTVITIHKR